MLLRNISGLPGVGLVPEPSAQQVLKAGGGIGFKTHQPTAEDWEYVCQFIPEFCPQNGTPVNTVQPTGPDVTVTPEVATTQEPAVQPPSTGETGKKLPLLPLLSLGGLLLTMAGIRPFGKVATNLVFAGGLALLLFELKAAHKAAE